MTIHGRPTSANGHENVVGDRSFGTYKNKSVEFFGKTNERNASNNQYFFLYRARVDAMAPEIVERAKRTIDSNLERVALVDLKPGKDAFVVGVVLKKMKYRQSVLYEFLDEDTLDRDVREGIAGENLVSDADQLEFEDSQQKMRLIGNIDKAHFVTGNVIGVYGMLERDDLLRVKQVVFPELTAQPEWPQLGDRDRYVLFISGIALHPGTKDQATRDALRGLSDWFNDEHMNEEGITRNICRIVIAGESIRVTEEDVVKPSIGFLGLEDNSSDEAVGHIDVFLSHMVDAAPVDLMPGPNDPCSLLLPQKPIPRMLFPLACDMGACFRTVTNPYKFELDGLNFLGTAGQNIHDMKRLTKGLSTIDLMQQCLERGHLFPTAPDTLNAWPLVDGDPFVLRELPHVFFAGSQEKFAFKWIDGGDGSHKGRCLLLALPTFARSKTVVLLNLRNMELSEPKIPLS